MINRPRRRAVLHDAALLNFPEQATQIPIPAFGSRHWRRVMASNARIFFAGIGTSFVILALGFGAGLIMAKSTLHEPPLKNRTASEPSPGMRIILPASAE